MAAMMLAEVTGTGMLAVVGVGGAVGLIIYAVATQAEEKSLVRSSLRQLDGYEVENVRDQELLNPLRERAVGPAIERLTDLGRRFTPAGHVDKVRQKFLYAGEAGADVVDRFLATQVLGVVVAAVASIFCFFALEGMLKWAAITLFLLAGIVGPSARLNRRVE